MQILEANVSLLLIINFIGILKLQARTEGGGPWGPGPLLRRTNVCRGVEEKQFLGSEKFFSPPWAYSSESCPPLRKLLGTGLSRSFFSVVKKKI